MNTDLISSVDFAPTILSLAGIDIPNYIQGQAFLGKQSSSEKRRYVLQLVTVWMSATIGFAVFVINSSDIFTILCPISLNTWM